jgi:hypothetical protein
MGEAGEDPDKLKILEETRRGQRGPGDGMVSQDRWEQEGVGGDGTGGGSGVGRIGAGARSGSSEEGDVSAQRWMGQRIWGGG